MPHSNQFGATLSTAQAPRGGCSLISPMGYQTNLMVYGPGGYRFVNYVRMGVPLTVLVGIIALLLVPIVFPF